MTTGRDQLTDTQTARFAPPAQFVEGYLNESLAAATVSSGTLTVKTAELYVWSFVNGQWVDTLSTVTVTNVDEHLSAPSGYYCRAVWIPPLGTDTSDGQFRADYVSCGTTALDIDRS